MVDFVRSVTRSQIKSLTSILSRKKCRKPDTDNREDEDIVFPYPVTRDRDETRRLDLAKESRPYEYGLVGRSMPTTSSGGSPSMIYDSGDGRRDSITALIGATGGLTPTMSGTVASIPGAQTRGSEVGRQGSHSSTHHQLPPGAAPPLRHSPSVTGSGSVSGSSTAPGPSNRRPLQVINPPLSPISPASIRTGFSPDDVPSSGSVSMEPEKQSVRSEKKSAHAFSSLSNGPILIHSVVTFRAVTADHLHQALGEFLRESPPPSRTDNGILLTPLRHMWPRFFGETNIRLGVRGNPHPLSPSSLTIQHTASGRKTVYTLRIGNDKERGGIPTCSSRSE